MSVSKPNWVLKHESKGKKATKIRNNYYLYKISSKWDPKKKRPVKKTEEYLGRISEEGLIPPKHKRIEKDYQQISAKEYGSTYFLQSISQDIIDKLKEIYPYEWKELFSLAVFRLCEKSPLKRIDFYYKNSYLSESLKDVRTSRKFLGPFLREIGNRREFIKRFMRSFMVASEYAIIDLTNIFSYSQSVISAVLGYNKDKIYIPQINLILIYSLDKMQPVYFRQVPGSVRDVSTIVKTVRESHGEKFVLIGDKGLHSDNNVKELQENKIDYVLALKRNSKYIDYKRIIEGKRKKFDGYFVYNKRHVWYYTEKINDSENVITYLDECLKAEEESDLAMRIKHLEEKAKEKKINDQEQKKLEDYHIRLFDKPYRNGTLSVRTNLKKSAEEVYQIMKSRVNVEQAFDTFKNVLEADKSYMRDDKQFEGWLFVNFISLQMYYKIYALLLKKKMLNNYSPLDVIIHLKRVYNLKIKDKWQLAEIPKESKKIIEKLKIDIPIT